MRALTAILGLWVTTGCVTHRSLPLTPPRQAAIAELAVQIGDRPVALDLETAHVPEAIDVQVRSDSLRWRTSEGGSHAVDLSQVRRIEIRNRPRGALDGLLAGVALAVFAGGTAALCCERSGDAWIAPEYAVGIGVGLVAIPLGTLAGVVRGHRIVYEAR